jgi:ribonucleoside-triphosphate reductase
LNTVVDSTFAGRRLTGIEAMSIDHELASAVIAGGNRRSARMAIMSWRDPDVFNFINVKSNSQSHWTTNISVEIDSAFRRALENSNSTMHAHAKRVLHAVADGMVRNGEPGLVDTELMSRHEPSPTRITNPCGEVNLHSYDLDGQIAGESCNLGSVDLDAFGTDHEGAQRAFTLMARFLYRATLNPHLDPLASHIEHTNRRIGVGIMGLQGWCAANGARLSEIETNHELRDHLTSFRKTVRKAADALAKELGTPRSVKVTAVAPTGSIAQLRGTQPGIHPIVARYFIRRVRYSTADPGLQALVDSGLTVVDDIYAANTSVVEFTLKDSILDRFDHSLIEQSDEIDVDNFFGIIATVQETFCGGSDGNAVSATAQIDVDASPENLARAIRFRLGTVKGLTVFPKVSRPLAPYEAISEAEYEVALAAGLAQTNGDSNDGECATGACPIR